MDNFSIETIMKFGNFLGSICDKDSFVIIKELFPGYIEENNIVSGDDLKMRLRDENLKLAKNKISQCYDEAEKTGMSSRFKSYLRGLSARAFLCHIDIMSIEFYRRIYNE